MKRRDFLTLLGAAPLAAMAPWQPPATWQANMVNGLMAGIDLAHREPSRSWLVVWNEQRIEGIFPPADERFIRARYEGDGKSERFIKFDASDNGLDWREL